MIDMLKKHWPPPLRVDSITGPSGPQVVRVKMTPPDRKIWKLQLSNDIFTPDMANNKVLINCIKDYPIILCAYVGGCPTAWFLTVLMVICQGVLGVLQTIRLFPIVPYVISPNRGQNEWNFTLLLVFIILSESWEGNCQRTVHEP